MSTHTAESDRSEDRSTRRSRDRSEATADRGASSGADAERRADRLQQTRGNRAVARAVAAARDSRGDGPSSAIEGSDRAQRSERDGASGSGGDSSGGSGSSSGEGSSGSGSQSSATSTGTPTSIGRGVPLPSAARTAFESALGSSLEGVRLHTGPQAASVADSYDASAVTSGRNVYFNDGEYRPHSSAGRGLLTHELAHAAQQSPRSDADVGRADVVGRDHPMEREAAQVTRRIATGRDVGGVGATTSGGPVIARQTADEQAQPVTTGPPAPEFGPPQASAGEREGEEPAGPPLDLQGSATVHAAAIESRLPEDATRGTIPVRFGSLAQGEITVKRRPSGEYGTPKNQTLQFSHPGLAPLAEQDVSPALVVDLTDGTLNGFVSLAGGRRDVMQKGALFNWIAANPGLMGWAGLGDLKIPGFENSIQGGQLVTKVDGFSFTLGGFMDGTGSFGLVGETVVFDAEADVDVKGLEEGKLIIQRTPEGFLTGSADVGVAFDTFSGSVHAEYGNGTVSMEGTAAYTGEKFDGSVTLLVTHKDRAENLARERLGPEGVQEEAEEAEGEEVAPAEEPEAGPQPGPRAVAGYGTVNVNLTEWFAGSAEVIVDGKGDVTVVGEVAPPAEVTLFEQDDYVHEFPRLEVKAIYGVPVVGNLNVFANIGLDAIAKLGPGTLYDIVLEGTYSTDPQVFQNYSLAASLNISAFAGVRLRAEGGVGVTIVSHDLEAGVGIESTAGIRGYVDARPTIGYREQADPEQGKTGQFYVAGHMEIAAKPSIALAGDLFVRLDSPWPSPAPDKTWKWPLGELEYPLPGEFGISADVEHVLGSGTVPDIEFGEVAFDSEKFMTDLMNDNVPKGGDGEVETEGTFEDQGEEPDQPAVEPTESEGTGSVERPPEQRGGGAAPKGPVKGRQERGDSEPPDPSIERQWQGAMQALMDLRQRARRDPLTREELDAELAKIRRQYRFSTLRVDRKGSDWVVTAGMNPREIFRFEAESEPEAEVEEPIYGEQTMHEVVRAKQQEIREMQVRASEAGVSTQRIQSIRESHDDNPNRHLQVLETEIELHRKVGRTEPGHEPASAEALAEREKAAEERRVSGPGSPEEGKQYGAMPHEQYKRKLKQEFGASNVDEEVQIYPHGPDGQPKDFYFIPDIIVKAGSDYHVYEVKIGETTGLTANQRKGYPLLAANGATVRSKSTVLFKQGDKIPPVRTITKVTSREDPRKENVPFGQLTLVEERL